MALPDSFIQELKARSDIVDVISSYVNLKRTGRNMVGLCPFHGEKTPSFHVNVENAYFHCFGCGAGGDVITFIRRIENLDYLDAVRLLAQRAGMTVPMEGVDDKTARIRARIFEANREAARFFHRMLYSPQGTQALAYLRGRGLKESTIKHFGLGYAPPGRFALVDALRGKGFRDEELVTANLAFAGRRGNAVDRFVDRVMFPIIDLRGNVIAFGGRIMGDGKPKYLNTSDTVVFRKSNQLFALNFAKNSGEQRLILVEGYMDVIALHQAGFTNAVATLGTALAVDHARLIARYTKEVIVSYDSDAAGQKAADRAIPMLRDAGLTVRVLSVPGSKDPDEYIRSFGEQGPARFKQLLDATGNDVEYRLQKVKSGCDLSTAEGKISYLNGAVSVLSTLDSRMEQEIYAGRLSEEVGIQKSAVMQQVDKLLRKRMRSVQTKQVREIQQSVSAQRDHVNPQRAGHLRAAHAEEALIAYVINNPDMAKNIKEQMPPDAMVTDFNRRVYQLILGRIQEGRPADLMDLSQDFSMEEMGRITQILASAPPAGDTWESAREYIRVIRLEKESLTAADVPSAGMEDINKYLETLKELKK
ncbi:MAG: DNA primase [Clostridium sp.]